VNPEQKMDQDGYKSISGISQHILRVKSQEQQTPKHGIIICFLSIA
jgi:hypothetical protein